VAKLTDGALYILWTATTYHTRSRLGAGTSFLAMDEHSTHANHAFWSEVGYTATSIIFILAGVKSETKIEQMILVFSDDFIVDKTELCGSLVDEPSCLEHHICR
jgi:hypothetical protein